ncbi:MAG: heavy metal translocating P-type ATPase [Saprospiraceae bacterium]
MKKLQIKIPLILPEVPDEKDQCVDMLINRLRDAKGLEKVHLSEKTDNGVPQLCFHYDPDLISLDRVRTLARQTGAEITEKIGHKLIEVSGIRHTRHARNVERKLQRLNGVLEVAVSASGMVRLEFDTSQTNETVLFQALRKEGLDIPDTKVSAERFLQKIEVAESVRKEKRTDEKEHDHDHEEGEPHDHAHGGIFGKNTELIFSMICGVLLGVGFGLSYFEAAPSWLSLALYIGAYFFGGFFTAKEAIETVARGGFEIDFLMLVAAIGAALLGEWAEGALLLFLFSLGHALEHYAMNKARKSIAALADLAPKTALLKQNGKIEEVGIGQLSIGDIIVVKPNSKISADGVVVNGKSSVNQAPITGESVPVDKVPVDDPDRDWSDKSEIRDENRVFSGTINGNNTLEIKVIKAAKDSTLSRLVKLVNEAQTQKSPTQRFTDKFEKYFVPSVLLLVVVLNFAFLVVDETFSESFYRAMAVLVAASPCALAISHPECRAERSSPGGQRWGADQGWTTAGRSGRTYCCGL